MMLSSVSVVPAILAIITTAHPAPQSCLHHYPITNHTVPLYPPKVPALDNFEADITLGTQTVRGNIDSGSSQTWFLTPQTQCLNSTGQPISSSQCGYSGPRWTPDSSFQPLEAHLNNSYANGDSTVSLAGYTPLTFGGVHVPYALVGAVENVSTSYNVTSSGLIGLGYIGGTNMYAGNDPSTDKRCNTTINSNQTGCNTEFFNPLQTTLFSNGLSPQVLSFALSRSNTSGGVMGIGGIPDLADPQVNVTSNALEATTWLVKPATQSVSTYYLITVDDLHFPGSNTSGGEPTLYEIDTGTVPSKIAPTLASSYNALFDPPAVFNKTLDSYLVYCNATAPPLEVEISGVRIMHDPRDMILSSGVPSEAFCLSGVQPGVEDGYILGSAWLRSVLVVFDLGEGVATVANRLYYEDSE